MNGQNKINYTPVEKTVFIFAQRKKNIYTFTQFCSQTNFY